MAGRERVLEQIESGRPRDNLSPSSCLEQHTLARLKMSYEDFLAWSDEDTHAEWVNGEVIQFMPPKKVHQSTLEFLATLLQLFIRLFDSGQVVVAPFEMKLAPDRPAREPDIMFVLQENLHRLSEDRLAGPADLCIEIVSRDSVKRDRDDKFQEYRDAGVQEYWVVDPRPGKRRADFFALTQNEQYELFATEDDERVESRVLPGFWLRPEWLWQSSSLDPMQIFFEMRGLSQDQIASITALLRGNSL